MSRSLFSLFLALVFFSGCDSCRNDSPTQSGVRFSKEAAAAAKLPWQPWSAEIVAHAREAGKPVVISLTDPLCYWCETFDRATLSNERVIEVLQDKFLLVRVEKERQPHVAARLEKGLPAVAGLDKEGEQVWFANFLQPTAFNQGLYKLLRGELLTILSSGSSRYQPRPGTPSGDTVRELLGALASQYEYEEKSYPGETRSLALSQARFDMSVGEPAGDSQARIRLLTHLDSVMAALRDPAGGFATGSFRSKWTPVNPIKYADEQAEMAALIAMLGNSQWRALAGNYEAYAEAAAKAIGWLDSNLLQDGNLLPGELGSAETYGVALEIPKPAWKPMPRTDAAGATAAALADAGRMAGKAAWIETAQKIADRFLANRTPEGLFWHVPEWKTAPNQLPDAAAMLAATVALYQADGDEKWLTAAQEIALAMEQLTALEGYFVDTTTGADAVFPPEPLPAANMRAAAALWRLGCILDAFPYRERAKRVVQAFSGNTLVLENAIGDYGVLVWQMTGPGGQIELPRAWRDKPEAAWLLRNPAARYYYRWTDKPVARICEDGRCTKAYATPAEAEQAAKEYLASLKLPG